MLFVGIWPANVESGVKLGPGPLIVIMCNIDSAADVAS